MALSEVRVPKAAELVAAQLRSRIIRGELAEGDYLPSEPELMKQFRVSRPTLREAIRLLEAEALVTVRRGSRLGAEVHVPRGDVIARNTGLLLQYRGATLADVHEARALIEPACAGVVAGRRSPADLKRLWAAINEAEQQLDNPNRGVHLQQEFHSLIIGMAGNETMKVLAGIVSHIIDLAAFSKVARDAGTPSERTAMHVGFKHHRQLVELIEEQDVEGAERLWRKHTFDTRDYLLDRASASTVLELLD